MSQSTPTDSEIDVYSKQFLNHGDKSKSWSAAFPKSRAKKEAVNVSASRFHTFAKVLLRIEELRKTTVALAEKKFTITIEQRLRWLNEIVDAGLEKIEDATGASKRQNLPAAKSAIDARN